MSAVLSHDGRYRYVLERSWGRHSLYPKPHAAFNGPQTSLLWVMLNPSTADASVDDATVRKCRAFSGMFDFGGMVIVNLFAYRTSSPKELRAQSYFSRVGPLNEHYVLDALNRTDATVVAWGRLFGAYEQEHANVYLEMLRAKRPVHQLRVNQDGSPGHPLYLPLNSKLGCRDLRGTK